jgi:hypothetical protein
MRSARPNWRLRRRRLSIVKANNEKYELKKMVDQLKEDIRIKDMDRRNLLESTEEQRPSS